MANVVFCPAADVDLLVIWDFIARDNSDAADNYLRWLADKLKLLATQPFMGKAREDLRPGLRSFVVGNHIILEGRQNIETLFSEG